MMKTDKSVIIIGGNTAAMRAQRMLRGVGVRSKTVRRTDVYGRGCVYGLEVESRDVGTAIYIFRTNGVSYELP